MGGREYAIIAGGGGNADPDAIERVIASSAMALPCFTGHGGPYATTKGVIRGEVAARDRAALATLYCALVSDLMLTRMGTTAGDLIVEGTFAGNLSFCQILGALRPTQRVFRAEDAAGTARGAAMLAQWPPSYHVAEPVHVAPTSIATLDSYRKAWTAAVDLIAR
jgi:glycerol kinase